LIEAILGLVAQLSPDGFEEFFEVVDQLDVYEEETEEQFE
jgi:hypothetical protein